MASYRAEVSWKNDSEEFLQGRYSRAHVWRFDGGIEVKASASPHVVQLPYSVEDAVDPEEAFVASLASCHMLTFLHLAAKRRFLVQSYVDDAVGEMATNEKGREWVARVVLRPRVEFVGTKMPSPADVRSLHELAHEHCFIANSVKTEVVCEPPDQPF